jgi:hypothetical protein
MRQELQHSVCTCSIVFKILNYIMCTRLWNQTKYKFLVTFRKIGALILGVKIVFAIVK